MAITYIYYNEQLPHGRLLRMTLNGLEQALEGLADLVGASAGVMPRMIDGDPGDPASFTEVKTRFGFMSITEAKAAYEELNAVFAKLSTNAPVDTVYEAILQAISKFKLA
jgi:hypothetical protein